MYVSSTIQVEIYFVLRSTYYVLGVPVAAVFRFCNTKQTFFYNELLYQVLVYQQLLNTPEYCYSCRHKSHRTRQHARCADLRLWGQTSYQSAPSSVWGGRAPKATLSWSRWHVRTLGLMYVEISKFFVQFFHKNRSIMWDELVAILMCHRHESIWGTSTRTLLLQNVVVVVLVVVN